MILCALCVAICDHSRATCAPPTITHLSPAGTQRGKSVDVAVAGVFDANTKVWTNSTDLTIENAKGKLKITASPNAVPGVHWLRTYNDEGASTLRPFIVGTLPEIAEKEPNDEFKKPQQIEVPACVINGKLEKSGDVDCYAVTLKKGQTLVASLEAHRTLRSPMDGMLQIVSADGFVLDENNDWNELDPQIVFNAKKDGVYIARVYAFPSMPDSSIRYFGSDACVYRLTLTSGPFADFAVPLALNQAEPWNADVEGWNIPPAKPKLSFVAKSNEVIGFESSWANPLRFPTLSFATHGEKYNTPLTLPFAVTNRIEKANGESLTVFDGKKGQAITIVAESRKFGLAVNPVVRLLDSEGKQLARAEPAKLNGDTALSFTLPADAKYTIAVKDLYAGGGSRHVFLLQVLTEPDYELTLAADRYTITPGKPTLVAVKVARVRGFNKPIEITGTGLPDSVKIETTTPAKPDPNTITLSLTSEKPFSGAFQLRGVVKDEPQLTRPVRATNADFEEPTENLWLTVTSVAKGK
jgi:hypothetical protein